MMLRKIARTFLMMIMFLYGAYVAGVMILLNTPLFATITEMEDTNLTHVRFSGAISWFPGQLWIQRGSVTVADQNVTIPIHISRASARFKILPIFKKKIEVTSLSVSEVQLDIGMKTEKESVRHLKRYTRAQDLNFKKKREKVTELKKERWSLNFPQIEIDRISKVNTSWGEFVGHLQLNGGFRIQPKVEVEIYPSTLRFISGAMPPQFTEASGVAQVRFHPFRIVDAPGNAVFPYVDLELDLKTRLQSLKLINLTLRKLKGYSVESAAGSQITIKLRVDRGHLRQGSFFDLEPSQLRIQTPSLIAKGVGMIRWKVDQSHASLLLGQLNGIRFHEEKKHQIESKMKNAHFRFRLFGNDLVGAFHGLSMRFDFAGLRWSMERSSPKEESLLKAQVRGKGTLTGFAGDVSPRHRQQLASSHLLLHIPYLQFKSKTFPSIVGQGDLKVEGKPIALTGQEIHFPRAEGNIDFSMNGHGQASTRVQIENIEHLLSPENTWKGKIKVDVDQTEPIIRALKEREQLSGIMASLGSVRHLRADLEFESKSKYSWIRLNELTSDGSWNAYGTLLRLKNEWKGDFEATILSIPIGIRLRSENMEVQVLPSTQWYDRSF